MGTNYDNLLAEELRELLLEDKLEHTLMSEEDYTAILDYEGFLGNPNDKVLDFCLEGLSRFEKYNNDSSLGFNIHELINEFETQQTKPKTYKRRPLKLILAVAVAILACMLLSQIVCLAFGFDLFGYIFNWDKQEVLLIEHLNATENGLIENPIEYQNADEVPNEMRGLLSDYLCENYDFYNSVFIKNPYTQYNFNFIDKNNNLLGLCVTNASNYEIEKDDNEQPNEYVIDDVVFTIFTNKGDYQAIWLDEEWIYHIYTQIELDELKEILNNFY